MPENSAYKKYTQQIIEDKANIIKTVRISECYVYLYTIMVLSVLCYLLQLKY